MAKFIEVLIMEGVAGIMFWLSYAIGIQQRMNLIAGYNEKTAHLVVDKPGLARLIGRICFLVGIGAAVMPVATAVWSGSLRGFYACMGAFGGYLAGIIAFTMLQARDYTRRNGKSDS